ncbi:hypothetical protein AMAG_17970 [Allomyces macrogynus ATCC 38327]|uniref:Uncharacterized protein n=1 Tax=Allomyces macrogynus (strain ATCC 38327) TaxID=578462 RepID=A0A0L0S307_ALLM3|nr:hypothetical protein AMAG_17970 [Allomyces macrogynus ATCC 38327]|eukprot:KNE56786.1 hypothetical protein AMAG_17970 [Allomyces macrogynus ATCC 38327]
MGQSLGINPHRVAAVASMTAHSAAQFLNPNHLVASVSALDRVDLPPRLRDRRVSIFAENPSRTVDSRGSVPLSPISSNGIAVSGASQYSGPSVVESRADASSQRSRPISEGGAAGGSTVGIRAEAIPRPVPMPPPPVSPPPASPPASVAPLSGATKSERSTGAQRSSPQLPSLDVRSHHFDASDDDEVDDAWRSDQGHEGR